MSRFNTTGHQAKPAVATAASPLSTVSHSVPDTRTFEGGAGWVKDAQTDLFLPASASFNDGKDKFYESGYERDEKLRQLARQVAVENPAWFYEFVLWLRRTANIRTSAIMCACDGVKARLEQVKGDAPAWTAGMKHWNRMIIDAVLYRADEPGELLAYWTHQYGRRIPKPVKRGVADAVRRLYNQRSLLKYDTASHAYRFGDVLNIVHPEHKLPADYLDRLPEDRLEEMTKEDRLVYIEDGHKKLGELFQYALDRRHNPDTAQPGEALHIVRKNADFRKRVKANPRILCDPAQLWEAAMTWEDALSLSGTVGVEKKDVWEAMAPSMGYMALLRNLRNFDEAGISNKAANQVIVKLVREDEVAKSRQLPFRFYSAYKNAPSLRWGHALETALDLCLPNIPELPGRTLILTDTSASMRAHVSEKSTIQCLEAAALFGSALAAKNVGRADFYQYATFTAAIPVPRGGSVLRLTEAIAQQTGAVGHGTDIAGAIRATYKGHDRVIILSDGQGTRSQSSGGVAASVPTNVPVYLFNIEGYSASPMPTGTGARFDLGGLSDQTFKLIPLLEAGNGAWPWEVQDIAS